MKTEENLEEKLMLKNIENEHYLGNKELFGKGLEGVLNQKLQNAIDSGIPGILIKP